MIKLQNGLVIDSTQNLKDNLYALLEHNGPIALDLETTGLDTFNDEIVGISISDGSLNFYISLLSENKSDLMLVFKDFIETKIENRLWIIQNLKFDYKFLKNKGVNLLFNNNKIYDTKLASYIHNSSLSSSLKNQAARILGVQMTTFESLFSHPDVNKYIEGKASNLVPLTKMTKRGEKPLTEKQKAKALHQAASNLKDSMTIKDIPIEITAKYSIDDAIYTYQLYKYYTNIKDEKFEKLVDLENKLAVVLSDMEIDGVKVDKNFLRQFDSKVSLELNKITEEIRLLTDDPDLNINSTIQLGKFLFDTLKIPYKGKMTAAGKYKTDTKKLEEIKSKDKTGFVSKILEYRQLSKIKETYVSNLLEMPDVNSILHCQFNQSKTATGRLSSSDPNLQNIPTKTEMGKEIRKSFISRFDSGIILTADYSQIELRILAHLCQDPHLIKAFKNGEDIHKRTASEVFNIPIEDVTTEQRYKCKTLNFALLYQQGPSSTAQQLGISYEEAKDLMYKYFSKFTTLKPYFNKLIMFAKKHGYIETMYGRRRYFSDINSNVEFLAKEEERACCNMPIQGSAADILKIGMIAVSDRMRKENMKSVLVLNVHDEIVCDVFPDELDKMKLIMKTEMELFQPLSVPLIVNLNSGVNYYEAK